MTWVSVHVLHTECIVLMFLLAHEGNGIPYEPLTYNIPYHDNRPCNSCGRPTCTEDEGAEGGSIEGTRPYTH